MTLEGSQSARAGDPSDGFVELPLPPSTTPGVKLVALIFGTRAPMYCSPRALILPAESIRASSWVNVSNHCERKAMKTHRIDTLEMFHGPEPGVALDPVSRVHERLRGVHEVDDVLQRTLFIRNVKVLTNAHASVSNGSELYTHILSPDKPIP